MQFICTKKYYKNNNNLKPNRNDHLNHFNHRKFISRTFYFVVDQGAGVQILIFLHTSAVVHDRPHRLGKGRIIGATLQ